MKIKCFLICFVQVSSESKSSEGQTKMISALLRCTICKGTSCNPISLYCFHSLCKECVEETVRESNQQAGNSDNNSVVLLDCPSCNYRTSFDESVSLKTDLKTHLTPQAIKALLDIEFGLNSPVCVSCKNRGKTKPSLFWCFDCIDHLCEECSDFHSSLPMLDKHKMYSLAEVQKHPDLVTKAREICAKHNLRFTRLCSERKCVCCDCCLCSDHIDVCKGEHKEIQPEMIAKLVNPQVTELQESLRNMFRDIDSKKKELYDVESKTEEFFKEEQLKANEKCQNLKKMWRESSNLLIEESCKVTSYKLQEMMSRNITLKQRKSVLQNAIELLSVLKGGSDVMFFLEVKKIKNVSKQSKVVLDENGKINTKILSVSFEKTLTKFCDLTCFGEMKVIKPIRHQHLTDFGIPYTHLSDTEFEHGSSDSNSWKNESSESEESSSDDSSISKCFKFSESVFTFSSSIDLENGFSHVTGCDWKSENEIIIVDQKVKGKPEIRVYDIHTGDVTSKVRLHQKPYGISVLPDDEYAITFPNEMKVRVYSLIDYSLLREVDVGRKCYGVFYCDHHCGGITMVAGGDNIIFYDKTFSETKCLTVEGEDIRYICAYNNNLIFYSDIKTNRVYSVIGNGDNRFEYTDDDGIKGAAGLIIDETKRIYVCEKGADCIHVLSKSGDFIRKIDVGKNPTAISLSEDETKICIIRGGRHDNNVADIYSA